MFVAAISEYNQVLQEDNTTNRLYESMNLFKQIVALPNFSKAQFILFLNKTDIFESKFPQSHQIFNKLFPGYEGEWRVATFDFGFE